MLQNLSLNLQVHKEEHTSGSPSQPRSLRGQVGAWRLTARLGHTFGRSFAFLDLLGKKYLLTYSSDTHNFAFPQPSCDFVWCFHRLHCDFSQCRTSGPCAGLRTPFGLFPFFPRKTQAIDFSARLILSSFVCSILASLASSTALDVFARAVTLVDDETLLDLGMRTGTSPSGERQSCGLRPRPLRVDGRQRRPLAAYGCHHRSGSFAASHSSDLVAAYRRLSGSGESSDLVTVYMRPSGSGERQSRSNSFAANHSSDLVMPIGGLRCQPFVRPRRRL